MPKIHPTAVVDPGARLADDVEIGPYCIIESGCELGAATVLREHVAIRRGTTMGTHNFVDANTVLGGNPQDLKFDPRTVSYLRIGDDNVFREGVTISRAGPAGCATLIGNKTYWMVNAHAGHDAVVEDETILTNGSAVGGHATIGRRAILSGCVSVHQFCWIGEMVMSQGLAGASMHVPPFTIFAGINAVVGLNVVGLRRAPDITDDDRRQVKEGFSLLYRSGLTIASALERMDRCDDWGAPAGRFRDFVHRVLLAEPPYKRGVMPLGRRRVR